MRSSPRYALLLAGPALLLAACSDQSADSSGDKSPKPGDPGLTIAGTSGPEGHAGTAAFEFVVTLEPAAGSAVQVRYQTRSGTARENTDFNAASGELEFLPGETRK